MRMITRSIGFLHQLLGNPKTTPEFCREKRHISQSSKDPLSAFLIREVQVIGKIGG